MTDVVEISQLVLREREGRDRGWWTQMSECFHDDSLVHLSWFHGPGAEFVAQSRARHEAGGVRPVHRCSPPVVHHKGQRAVVNLSLNVEARMIVHDVEVDLISSMRLLYQVEKNEGPWKIKALQCIYERDTLTPAIPNTPLVLDIERLQRFRMPYRCLAYQFSLRGISVNDDLYGDDEPGKVEALYALAFRWLERS